MLGREKAAWSFTLRTQKNHRAQPLALAESSGKGLRHWELDFPDSVDLIRRGASQAQAVYAQSLVVSKLLSSDRFYQFSTVVKCRVLFLVSLIYFAKLQCRYSIFSLRSNTPFVRHHSVLDIPSHPRKRAMIATATHLPRKHLCKNTRTCCRGCASKTSIFSP